MNTRERFLATALYGETDRPYIPAPMAWPEAVERWQGEGLPEGVSPVDYFQVDAMYSYVEANTGFCHSAFCPAFEQKVMEDRGDKQVTQNEDGILFLEDKNPEVAQFGMPQFLRFPVETRDDFENMRWRLDPDSPERFPRNWADITLEYAQRDYPLVMTICGGFGLPRNLMGFEGYLMALCTDPDLIHTIMRHWVDFYQRLLVRVVSEVDIDGVLFWEDMAFKNGPMMSPDMFHEFMLPYYQEFVATAKDLGVRLFMVDTDGDARLLIPPFIEAGVNCLLPFEVTNGQDIRDIRDEYGRAFSIIGGLDKKAMAAGGDVLEHEIRDKVRHLFRDGGYAPHADHGVPPDVSFENICRCMAIITEEVKRRYDTQ